jgi:phospholipid/cholesterol/gamma-HCH transport system permease protein
VDPVAIDLSGAEQVDGGVLALLRADVLRRGIGIEFRGAERFQALLDLYGCTGAPLRAARGENEVTRVGRAVVEDAVDLERAVGFVGELTVAAGRVARWPKRGHWTEIPSLVEQAGADAIPIVCVINFLVGFVMAYMSARALTMFGANIYVADLVGIAMTRQLAPIMTAIVVCGRTGAAFAAELGSMKVSEEIDALRTLGLPPVAWLVIPRIIALLLVVPVLTVLADLVGVLGGLVVAMTSLGLSPHSYFTETRNVVVAWDVESGLVMSLAFALIIGLIACQQGFAAAGGAQGVGRRTTSTVVTCLFAIVLLDAIFTVLFRVFGLS